MPTDLTLTQVLGPVETPLGEKPANGRVYFALRESDREGNTTVAPVVIEVALDASANFATSIWASEAGEAGRPYAVWVEWWSEREGRLKSDPLGFVAVPISGPAYLADLWVADAGTFVPEEILAQCLAAEAAASSSAAVAVAAKDQAVAAAAVLDGFVATTPFGGVTVAGVTDYDLPYNPLAASYVHLYVGGVRQRPHVEGDPETGFQVITKTDSPSGFGFRLLDDILGGLEYWGHLQRPIDPDPNAQIATLAQFGNPALDDTKSAFVAYLAANDRMREPLVATFKVPTNAATLQALIDALGPSLPGDNIALEIQSGHAPTSGITVTDGDWSGYRITSVDPVVSVGAFSGDLVNSTNAHAPRLSCKLQANGRISITLTGAITVVAGETITQATTGANGVAVSNGTVSTLVLEDLDGGAFNNLNQLSGSTSGGLGANSVPTDIAPVSIVNGYYLDAGSTGFVDPGCGVDYCYDSGLIVYEGASCAFKGAEFNFAVRGANLSFGTRQTVFRSGIHVWGGWGYGEGAQANDSGFYGIQFSHGGGGMARNGDAQRAWRHSLRLSDGAYADIEAFNADDSARDGNGSCIRAYEGTTLSGSNVKARNSGASAVRVRGSDANLPGIDATGATTQTVWADNGGRALMEAAILDPDAVFKIDDAAEVNVFGATGATSPTVVLTAGGKYIAPDGKVSLGAVHTFEDGIILGTGTDVLKNYEKGTFLPIFLGATTNPTCTYDIQEGQYTRIGDLVQVELAIGTDAVSGGSGNLRIGGLPFDFKDTTYNVVASGGAYATAWGANTPSGILGANNTNYATLSYRATANGPSANAQVSDMATGLNSNRFTISFSYITDEA